MVPSFLSDPLWLNHFNGKKPDRGMLLNSIEEYARNLKNHLYKPESLEDWSSHVVRLRSRLLYALGLARLPDRTPLNPRCIGTIERGPYRIEKIAYEPRPGFTVTAHLYIPNEKDSPAPAILYSLGHWMENGKLEPDIQIACANLARLGFIVLVYDPIGQGERLGSWRDHGHLEPLLAGLSQEGLMVWESMRAIDYLVSRPEVDLSRIGMTGASGGGLNTFYTSAIDGRIQVSAPVCYVTTFLSMMTAERDRNWEDGIDLCNQVPGVMAFAEMSDICGLFSPKPLCLIAGKKDWMFPIEGTREIYSETAWVYHLMDATDRLRLVEVDAEHGYSREMRQAAYGWFSFWLMGQGDGGGLPESECDLMPAPFPAALTYMAPPRMEDLPILRSPSRFPFTSEGLCFQSEGRPENGAAITTLVKNLSQELPPKLETPENAGEWQSLRPVLIDQIKAVLGKFPNAGRLTDWFYNQGQYKGVFFERIEFESEPGIRLPALFLAPTRWETHLPVVIYLDEWGKENGLTNGLIKGFLTAGVAVLAVDVRGRGETAVSDFEAATNALMTDRPLFGQQVWDVLKAIDELWQRTFIGVQIDKGRIGCFGRGTAGLLALYAAALDERVKTTVVSESLLSYRSLIVEESDFPASVFIFDVLNHFDLPHVISLVSPRFIFLANPVDGERQLLTPEQCENALSWTGQVYKVLACSENLTYRISETGQVSDDAIIDYIKNHL